MISLFKKEYQKSSSIFLGYLTMAIIIGLCINTFYWSDDYAFMVKIDKTSVIQNCIDGYNTWDGRFFALAAFVQGFLLKYVKVEFITLFWTICFIASSSLAVEIIKNQLPIHFTKSQFNKWAIFITAGFWISCYTNLSETVYWATGGVYSFDLLLAVLWIIWYLKGSKYHVLFLLFSFIVGATTQNLAIAIITLLLIDFLLHFLNKNNTQNKSNFLAFLFVIAGLLFISVAPGNQIRMEKTGINTDSFSVIESFKAIVNVTINYLKWSFLVFIFSSFAAFALLRFNKIGFKFDIHFYIPNSKPKIIKFLNDFKWLLVALSTIVPFIFGPQLAFPRTALFFMYFLMIFIIVFCYKSFSDEKTKTNQSNLLFFNCFYLIVIAFASYNFSIGISLKEFMLKREDLLKVNKNEEVTIKLVPQNLQSTCYKITDLPLVEDKMTAWRRLRLQDYYKVKKINVTQ